MAANVKAPYTRKNLEDEIKRAMDIKSITPVISKQISKLILDYNMTFKEIARCIVWYEEVFGGELNPVYGIAFVANVREQTEKYFKKLELDQQKQAQEASKIVEYQDNNIIFNIKSMPHKKRVAKQFNIEEIDVEGELDRDGK